MMIMYNNRKIRLKNQIDHLKIYQTLLIYLKMHANETINQIAANN
jgi:hypothetical protein